MANLIEKYPVPLILKKILMDGLSGELEVSTKDFNKKLFFSRGMLEFAASDLVQDRLGEMLVKKGKLTREHLVMLNRMMEKSGQKFGKLLIKYRMFNKQDVFIALHDQVTAIALSVFLLASGEWTFKKGSPRIPGNQKFEIHLPQLIIEGGKKISDFSFYINRFNFRCPVALPIPEALGQILSADMIRFYVKLTKCQAITSEQIQDLSGMPEKMFWRRVSTLYLLNLLDFTEFRVDSKFQQNVDTLEDIHDMLKAGTLDHYQLLELKDTASVSDVKEKYFAFTKKYNPDAISAAPGSQAGETAGFVMEKAKQAYKILIDEKKKKLYDTGEFQLKKAASTQEKNEVDRKDMKRKAREYYLLAQNLYEENRYYEAARLLDEAVKMDDSRSSYYLLLGLCQSQLPEYRPFAEKHLKKAAEMEPWNADPVFYLGKLYLSEGLVKKAERCFEQALDINMEHTMAGEMISTLQKRLKKKSGFSLFGKKS
jgi:tetratricopeptide (TPR) repeat protein